MGQPKTLVRIWSDDAVNKINHNTDHPRVLDILYNAGFRDFDPEFFLLFNKNDRYYQSAIYTPAESEWSDLFSIKKTALNDLETNARNFL